MRPAEHGHFTTMQVRGRAVQGLHLHLRRLADATREVFDVDLDASDVRVAMITALDAGGLDDATLRVTIGMHGAVDAPDRDAPHIEVTLAEPMMHPTQPLRLMTVIHQRALPHIKHVGTFASHHYRRVAQREGHDDALFVDADGRVLEGSFWNIGFWRGEAVVWPDGPALRGTGERLLQEGFGRLGIGQSKEAVRIADLHAMDGAFVVNARGVRPVASIGSIGWQPDPRRLAGLRALLGDAEWEPLLA